MDNRSPAHSFIHTAPQLLEHFRLPIPLQNQHQYLPPFPNRAISRPFLTSRNDPGLGIVVPLDQEAKHYDAEDESGLVP